MGIFQTLKSVDFLNAAKIRTRGMNIMRNIFRKVDAVSISINLILIIRSLLLLMELRAQRFHRAHFPMEFLTTQRLDKL